jgi:hypothetical protein
MEKSPTRVQPLGAWVYLNGDLSPEKHPIAGETGVRGFSKPRVTFLLLMETVEAVLPPPPPTDLVYMLLQSTK